MPQKYMNIFNYMCIHIYLYNDGMTTNEIEECIIPGITRKGGRNKSTTKGQQIYSKNYTFVYRIVTLFSSIALAINLH
jgi:hypothetical protein